MMADQSVTLLGTLSQGLAEHGAQVAGQAGEKVAAIGNSTGALPDFIREVLRVIAEALRSLRELMLTAEHFVVQADAAFGLIELTLDTVKPITTGRLFSGIPQALNLPSGPFDAADNGLQQVGNALDVVGEGVAAVSQFLPRPEDIRGISGEISILLGNVVAPEAEGPGPLANLLSGIGVELSSN